MKTSITFFPPAEVVRVLALRRACLLAVFRLLVRRTYSKERERRTYPLPLIDLIEFAFYLQAKGAERAPPFRCGKGSARQSAQKRDCSSDCVGGCEEERERERECYLDYLGCYLSCLSCSKKRRKREREPFSGKGKSGKKRRREREGLILLSGRR